MQQLFAGKYMEVAAGVLGRAKELRGKLGSASESKAKVEILSAMILVLQRGFEL